MASFCQSETLTPKNGVSFFGGLGFGGNGIKQGFSKGFSARTHFKQHTIDAYFGHTSKNEAGYTQGHDLKLTYDAVNCGLSYGYGLYDRHYSYAALIGIGYTNADVTTIDPTATQIFVARKYIRTCGVFGLQAGIRAGFVGLATKFYYNIFDGPSNYTLLIGVELTIQ